MLFDDHPPTFYGRVLGLSGKPAKPTLHDEPTRWSAPSTGSMRIATGTMGYKPRSPS
jgi:acetoacetate decarboxylase